MSRDAFLALTGATLLHATASENVKTIRRIGLCPAADLARRAGVDPAALLLRQTRTSLNVEGARVNLNHQRPLRAGRKAAAQFLEGHTLDSWARQLDNRVFLWPERGNAAFHASLPSGAALLRLDAGALYDHLADRLWLAPINSGNATRRPAQRGDWLYVPARRAATFRTNRQRLGKSRGRDTLREVSVSGSIPARILADVLL